jgi:tetratricopeptide (TPR) repeat protein
MNSGIYRMNFIRASFLVMTAVSAFVAVVQAGPPGVTRNRQTHAVDSQPAALPVEHQSVVDAYVTAYVSGSVSAVDRVVDYGALFDEVIATMDPGGLPGADALRGMRQGWSTSQVSLDAGFDPKRPKTTLCPGGVEVLNHKRHGENSEVLLRILRPEALLPEYTSLMIGKSSRNAVRILDVRLEHSGTSTSGMIRKGAIDLRRAIDRKNRGLPMPVSPVAEIRQALTSGGLDAAMEVIRKLSSEQKADPDVAGLCLVLTAKTGNRADLEQQLANFLRLHPDRSLLADFIALREHLGGESIDEALIIVDRLEHAFSGDAFLNVMRARLLLKQKKLDAAEKQARIAMIKDPKLPEVYDVQLRIAVARNDFSQAVSWLKSAKTKFADIELDLTGKTEYQDFVSSEEYREWQKYEKESVPGAPQNDRVLNDADTTNDGWDTLAGTEFSFPFPSEPIVTSDEAKGTIKYEFSVSGIDTMIVVRRLTPQKAEELLTEINKIDTAPADQSHYYRRRLMLFTEFPAIRVASRSPDGWRAMQIIVAPTYSVTSSITSTAPIDIPRKIVDSQFDALVRFAPNERPPELRPNSAAGSRPDNGRPPR